MTLEYNYKNNIKNVYNEVFDIIIKKKKILSNKKVKIGNFTKNNIIGILSILFIGSIVSILLEINNIPTDLIKTFDLFVIIITFGLFYNQLIFNKNLKVLKKSTANKIIIDENKITDISNEIEIKIDIEKITHVIIGKYSVNVIAGENAVHLFFPIEIKTKIINTIKKYNQNIEIIELNN